MRELTPSGPLLVTELAFAMRCVGERTPKHAHMRDVNGVHGVPVKPRFFKVCRCTTERRDLKKQKKKKTYNSSILFNCHYYLINFTSEKYLQ